MSFSDQAIGFYLEAEDVNLSSSLEKAAKSWDTYVKTLEKFNKRAFESHNKGLQALQAMMDAATDLPMKTARSIDKASALIARKIKPITQKVHLDVTAKSVAGLKKLIGQTVSDALSGANIRLGASFPNRQLSMFSNDMALRTQYGRIPQPPDMKGKISPLKKYREGGVVEGPNKAFDSVLAMLQPGELVIPRDVTQQLGRLGGRLLHRGTNVDIAEFRDVIKLARKYGNELSPVVDELERMEGNFADLSFAAKQQLGSAMLQTTKAANRLTEGIEETSVASKSLFDKFFGPINFIAAKQGLDSIHEGFKVLQGGVSKAFSTADGQQIGTFVNSINQMNQYLGMSRVELAGFKARAFEAAAAIDGVTVDEFAGGMLAAAEAGIREEKSLLAIAGAAAAAAKGTDIALDSAVAFGYELTQSRNFTQESFEAILATNAKLSEDFNVRASTLQAQTSKNLNTLTATLETLTEEQGRNLLISFNRIGAALPSSFIDAADEIQDVLGKALEGDPDALQQAGLIFGKPINQIREDLVKGDLGGLFTDLQKRIDGLNPQQIRAVSKVLDIGTADLVKFGAAGDEISSALTRSAESMISTGDAAEYMRERAAGNRTVFEQLQEVAVKWIGSMSLMGVSGVEVINFFAEVNPASLLAVGYFGKLAANATAAVGSFFGLGKAASFIGGGMKSMGMGLLKSVGPLALVAGLAAGVTMKISSLSDQIVETNAYAEKGEKAALTDFSKVGVDMMRVRKNIERTQKTVDIDKAAGRAVNPNALMLLERYNTQLAELEARSQGMIDAAKTPAVSDVGVNQNIAAALSSSDMDAIMNAQLAMGAPDNQGTEERLDRNNMLMEQMVGLMQQFVTRPPAGSPPPSPRSTLSGPSSTGSSFGRSVAGGDF